MSIIYNTSFTDNPSNLSVGISDRLFRLWLRLITFRGHSAHLANLVHKSGRKTSIIITIIIIITDNPYMPLRFDGCHMTASVWSDTDPRPLATWIYYWTLFHVNVFLFPKRHRLSQVYLQLTILFALPLIVTAPRPPASHLITAGGRIWC